MFFYLETLFIAVMVAGLIFRIIQRNLTKPLESVNKGIEDDWMRITSPDGKSPRWLEPFTLP